MREDTFQKQKGKGGKQNQTGWAKPHWQQKPSTAQQFYKGINHGAAKRQRGHRCVHPQVCLCQPTVQREVAPSYSTARGREAEADTNENYYFTDIWDQ